MTNVTMALIECADANHSKIDPAMTSRNAKNAQKAGAQITTKPRKTGKNDV